MSLHKAVEAARTARARAETIAPSTLYEFAGGDTQVYKHAMVEAGHVIPVGADEPLAECPICGYRHPTPATPGQLGML